MSLDSAIAGLVSRLETVTQRLVAVEKQLAEGGAPAVSNATSGGSSASVQEYEDLINQFVIPFGDLSTKLGDKAVADQAALFVHAVNAQRELLQTAASSKKPSDEQLQKLLQPTSDLMQKIVAIKDTNRASKFFNNLSTVAEGVQALGWVIVAPTPGPYVGDMRGGSEFYSNRLLKEFKASNQTQVDWVTAFNSFLKELQVYIKKNHTTGLTWNAKGGDVSAASKASTTSGAPPPPPGPAPPPMDFGTSTKGDSVDMSGVFTSIAKGEGVTAGLRKVTDDMKTKNRTDKSSVVPASALKSAEPKAETKQKAAAKPPKFALEGNKWLVEYQVGNKNIVINETEPKQVCYIFNCTNSTVQVKGKVNAITLDGCTKVAVVFDTVVSSFEVVNCRSVEVQALGKVPSVAIDKTSGCQLYLSKDALDTEIVSSKSSEMNVLMPGANQDSDLVEIAVPEQFKTFVKDGKLVTEAVQHV